MHIIKFFENLVRKQACVCVCSSGILSVFRQITFLFICSLVCRGGDRLPGIGLWRRETAQASGAAGGGAPGSRRGEASAPVESQFIRGKERRLWCEIND